MSKFASWLIAVLLVALVGLLGMLGSTTGLLMLLPIATLFLAIAVGWYPGERAIEALAELINLRRRVSRDSQLSHSVCFESHFIDVLVPGSLGSRGPPLSV